MNTQHGDPRSTFRELAHSMDCLTEEEVQTLTGWKDSTIDAYRKRGKGPSYIRIGKNFIYPRSGISAFLSSHTKERNTTAKAML